MHSVLRREGDLGFRGEDFQQTASHGTLAALSDMYLVSSSAADPVWMMLAAAQHSNRLFTDRDVGMCVRPQTLILPYSHRGACQHVLVAVVLCFGACCDATVTCDYSFSVFVFVVVVVVVVWVSGLLSRHC
jgi:hypothetical protein